MAIDAKGATMGRQVLLVSIHSFHNAGDAALTAVALEQLDRAFAGAGGCIKLAIDDIGAYAGSVTAVGSFTSFMKPILPDRSSPWRWGTIARLGVASLISGLWYRVTRRRSYLGTTPRERALLAAYYDADLVVSKPGGFLYTSGKVGLSFLLAVYTIAFACIAGKPTYILPQSIGPLLRRHERWLTRWLVRYLRITMVREPISLAALTALGVPEGRVRLRPDLAFAAPVASNSEADAYLLRHDVKVGLDRPLLGVTAIDWGAQNPAFPGQDSYESAVADAIRSFLSAHGGKVIFLPQVWGPTLGQDDRIVARRIAARLPELAGQIVLANEVDGAALLKAVYGRLDLLLGTRMHSLIFAISQGVPVVAIGYLTKTRGLLQMLGLQHWYVDILTVRGPDLAHLLANLWDERAQVRAHIQITVPEMVAQAAGCGAEISADYATLAKPTRP